MSRQLCCERTAGASQVQWEQQKGAAMTPPLRTLYMSHSTHRVEEDFSGRQALSEHSSSRRLAALLSDNRQVEVCIHSWSAQAPTLQQQAPRGTADRTSTTCVGCGVVWHQTSLPPLLFVT